MIHLFSVTPCLAYVIFPTVEKGKVGFGSAGFFRVFCCFHHLWSVWEGSSSDHKPEAKGWNPPWFKFLAVTTESSGFVCLAQLLVWEAAKAEHWDGLFWSLGPMKASKSILMCWGEALRHCSDKKLIKSDKSVMFWGGECISWTLTFSNHIFSFLLIQCCRVFLPVLFSGTVWSVWVQQFTELCEISADRCLPLRAFLSFPARQGSWDGRSDSWGRILLSGVWDWLRSRPGRTFLSWIARAVVGELRQG